MRYVSPKKAFFDTETTGVDFADDRVVSIGVVVGEHDKVIHEYYSMVNPERKSNPDAARVHGLTDEMLKGAPKFSEICHQFIDATIGQNVSSCVAHNADFDCVFVSQEMYRMFKAGNNPMAYAAEHYPDYILESERRYSFDEKTKKYVYTGRTLKEMFDPKKFYSLADIFSIEDTQLLAFNVADKNHVSLNSVAKQFGVDTSKREEIHDALEDSRVLMHTYYAIQKNALGGRDFADMQRDIQGLSFSVVSLKEQDRVPPELASKLVLLTSALPKVESKVDVENSEPAHVPSQPKRMKL